jgi:hypothetical protein
MIILTRECRFWRKAVARRAPAQSTRSTTAGRGVSPALSVPAEPTGTISSDGEMEKRAPALKPALPPLIDAIMPAVKPTLYCDRF